MRLFRRIAFIEAVTEIWGNWEKMDFYYKVSKVNGEQYLQVWKQEEGKNVYVGTIGKASKAAKVLVRLKYLEERTKELEEILTKTIKAKPHGKD